MHPRDARADADSLGEWHAFAPTASKTIPSEKKSHQEQIFREQNALALKNAGTRNCSRHNFGKPREKGHIEQHLKPAFEAWKRCNACSMLIFPYGVLVNRRCEDARVSISFVGRFRSKTSRRRGVRPPPSALECLKHSSERPHVSFSSREASHSV